MFCVPVTPQLPDDVRELTECPFPVDWQPVVSILQCQNPEVNAEGLRDTLKRKDVVRVLNANDLALRADPATEPGQEIRAAMEAHVSAGNAFETFT